MELVLGHKAAQITCAIINSMNPEENTEANTPEILETTQPNQLNTVTPLSKYLAMALFIMIPFVGGWIGYTYAPEKVVEVERVVIKEVPLKKRVILFEQGLPEHRSFGFHIGQDTSDWHVYENEKYGFKFQYPPDGIIDENENEVRIENSGVPPFFLIPNIVVSNNYSWSLEDVLARALDNWTLSMGVTTIDGIPAFWWCGGQMQSCHTTVVTDKYIFTLTGVSSVEFDDAVIGSYEKDFDWPKSAVLPELIWE